MITAALLTLGGALLVAKAFTGGTPIAAITGGMFIGLGALLYALLGMAG